MSQTLGEIGMKVQHPPVVMEEVIDPVELTEAHAQDERFARNWAWFEAHASEIYIRHRGKCLCVSGEELFIADTPEEALAQAISAHPEDDGRFTRIISKEKVARIYGDQRRLASV
jgi:hypothetical protein